MPTLWDEPDIQADVQRIESYINSYKDKFRLNLVGRRVRILSNYNGSQGSSPRSLKGETAVITNVTLDTHGRSLRLTCNLRLESNELWYRLPISFDQIELLDDPMFNECTGEDCKMCRDHISMWGDWRQL